MAMMDRLLSDLAPLFSQPQGDGAGKSLFDLGAYLLERPYLGPPPDAPPRYQGEWRSYTPPPTDAKPSRPATLADLDPDVRRIMDANARRWRTPHGAFAEVLPSSTRAAGDEQPPDHAPTSPSVAAQGFGFGALRAPFDLKAWLQDRPYVLQPGSRSPELRAHTPPPSYELPVPPLERWFSGRPISLAPQDQESINTGMRVVRHLGQRLAETPQSMMRLAAERQRLDGGDVPEEFFDAPDPLEAAQQALRREGAEWGAKTALELLGVGRVPGAAPRGAIGVNGGGRPPVPLPALIRPDFYVTRDGVVIPTPRGLPTENYLILPSRKNDGFRFTHLKNRNDIVRTMPGRPYSPFPAQQRPYTVQQRDGMAYDAFGNRVRRSDPDAHIPSSEFRYFSP